MDDTGYLRSKCLVPSPSSRQRGQAIVEAAIALPMMLMLILCILQLTLIQQARLMTYYAAFVACRAGVVYSADHDHMEAAAFMALRPTLGGKPPRDLSAFGANMKAIEAKNTHFKTLLGNPQVHVNVTSPRPEDFAKWGGHLKSQEIDFDDVRPGAQEATTLSVNLTYYYRMNIPFANRLLQTIWLAGHADTLKRWTGFNAAAPALDKNSGPAAIDAARKAAAGKDLDVDLKKLVAAGKAKAPDGGFYFPVRATYSMKMQSNPFKKNIP